MTTTWLLERDVFSDHHDRLADAAAGVGHSVVDWDDSWWDSGAFPELEGQVLFHGSLGNADRIARELSWLPGAYCSTDGFACTAWYEGASRWLVHKQWAKATVQQFVNHPDKVLSEFGGATQFFVRPNSPLKPFSGRVLDVDQLSLEALDHGFYYDDTGIEIVVAPVRNVGNEWRYVVIDKVVVTGSSYEANSRTESGDSWKGEPLALAELIAREIPPPERVYVLDVCECEGELKLLELNPFSGADLYACDREVIVRKLGLL